MSLPILDAGRELSSQDLVRLFHRTELHWTRHLGEETQLGAGTAFVNPELPGVYDANRVLDAAVPPGVSAQEAVAEVQGHFDQHGTRCWMWVPNPAASNEQTEPLIKALTAEGWTRQSADILHLAGRPTRVIREVGGLTIIPARASFKHARALADEGARQWHASQMADAAMLHLDDPHWDALLALKDGQVAGGAGVLAVGDVGRIDDVFVSERFRRQGIGLTLMSRALEICIRSTFRHVMLSCMADNTPAQTLYRSLGFRKVGEIIAYRAPATPPA